MAKAIDISPLVSDPLAEACRHGVALSSNQKLLFSSDLKPASSGEKQIQAVLVKAELILNLPSAVKMVVRRNKAKAFTSCFSGSVFKSFPVSGVALCVEQFHAVWSSGINAAGFSLSVLTIS